MPAWVGVLILALLPIQAAAQFESDITSSEQIAQWLEQMSVELIYPDTVDLGEIFVLHAYVHNGNDQSVRVSIAVQSGEADAYAMKRCRDYCGMAIIEPGQSRYITVGQMYYAGATLRQMPALTIKPTLSVMPSDSSFSPPLPSRTLDSVSIAVDSPADLPAPNAALYPVPAREPLTVADLREPDDQLLVRDPNTGYEWIRLDATAGIRMEDALHALETEDYLQGFQLARASQVEQLLLNHLHAEGYAAQAHSVRAMVENHELGTALAGFVGLLLPGATASTFSAQGVTADEPDTWDSGFPAAGSVTIYGYEGPPQTGTFRQIVGLLRGRTLLADDEDIELPMPGLWLVRGAPIFHIEEGRARYLNGELIIPLLQVGQKRYRAVLANVDSRLGVFRLISLRELSSTVDLAATGEVAQFDETRGLLTLPDLVLMQSDGAESTASATLRLVPETEPPAFELILLQD